MGNWKIGPFLAENPRVAAERSILPARLLPAGATSGAARALATQRFYFID
jgi:hypothetical protein